MVALVRDEHLCLALQAPERARVHDAVAVALERRAVRAFRFGMQPAARLRRIGRVNRTRRGALQFGQVWAGRGELCPSAMKPFS